MAGWIAGPVANRLPDAVRCVDPFHVIQLLKVHLARLASLELVHFERGAHGAYL